MVVVDSQVPHVDPAGGTTGDAVGYTCYLAAPGVIRTGSQFPLSIKQNEDILSLQDVMSVTYNRLDHVLGTSATRVTCTLRTAILLMKATGSWLTPAAKMFPWWN